MCYVKYDQDIVSKDKVKLVGWHESVKFANLSTIRTVNEIWKLHQALRVGECKWVVLSQRQQTAHAEMLAGKVAAGEPIVKKRKQRSDKGKQRGKGDKKAAVRMQENTCRMRRRQSPQVVRMAENRSASSHPRRERPWLQEGHVPQRNCPSLLRVRH